MMLIAIETVGHFSVLLPFRGEDLGVSISDDYVGVTGNLGVRAVLISFGVAVEQGEDEEDESADQGNEGDEIPPDAFADVVEAPDSDGERRDEKHKSIRGHHADWKHGRLALIGKGHGKQHQED